MQAPGNWIPAGAGMTNAGGGHGGLLKAATAWCTALPSRLILVVGGARQRRGRVVFVVLDRGVPRGNDVGA